MIHNQPTLKQEIYQTIHLALPLVAALLAQVSMEFVDTIMLGQLGPIALAAGGLGSAIYVAFFVCCLGVIIAIGTSVAHEYGKQQLETVSHIGRQGLWLALILSIPSMIILWFFPTLLVYLGQSVEVAEVTSHFLRSLLWAFFPSLGFFALREFIAGLARPYIVMFISLIAVPINAFLNYILMYGKFGFPRLGVAGVGYATAISQLLMFICLILYIFFKSHFKTYKLFNRFELPDLKKLKELFSLGWPIGITLLFEIGLFSITALLMGHLGTDQLAAHQIAIQTISVVYMIPLGVSQATMLRVGHAMGADDPYRAKKIAHIGLSVGLLIAVCTGVLLWMFSFQIADLFLDSHLKENYLVIQYAVLFLKVAALFQLVDVVQSVTNGALRGLKDTFIPMLLGLATYWGVGLASGYLLAFQGGEGGVGLWFGLALGIGSSALCLYGRFYWKINQNIQNLPLISAVRNS